MKSVEIDTPLPFFYVGPDLSLGPLPSVLYFSLSAEESLLVDPYNQPVCRLASQSMRIFSVDLPFHGKGLPATSAMTRWAEELASGRDCLGDFLEKLTLSTKTLFASGLLGNTAVMGLSRGCFVAAHLAAQIPQITTILAFAPLTQFSVIKEFHDIPQAKELTLSSLADSLCRKTLRVYIGGRDMRVDTDLCYRWIRDLIEKAYEAGLRSACIELFIKPSIGYLGHGTPKETFEEGASWLIEKL